MGKSIIVIGAGIAGLSAGCYAQMNDYRTRIFEMHDKPGGLCTSWKRQGYTFDGCIHRLLGSAPGQPFHRMWKELGGRLRVLEAAARRPLKQMSSEQDVTRR
jgi:phytoene dehydrogenase-like protein